MKLTEVKAEINIGNNIREHVPNDLGDINNSFRYSLINEYFESL